MSDVNQAAPPPMAYPAPPKAIIMAASIKSDTIRRAMAINAGTVRAGNEREIISSDE